MKVIGTTEAENPIVELDAKDRAAIREALKLLAAIPIHRFDLKIGGVTEPKIEDAGCRKMRAAPVKLQKTTAKLQGRLCEICEKPIRAGSKARCCSKRCLMEKARRAYREKYSARARKAALPASPKKTDAASKAARLEAIRAAAERVDPVDRIFAQAAAVEMEEG